MDSTVWLDYFEGTVTPQTDFLDRAPGWCWLGVGDPIHAEVLSVYSPRTPSAASAASTW